MLFELHLTAPSGVWVPGWKQVCEYSLGAKPLHIELHGAASSARKLQLMSAGTHSCPPQQGYIWALNQEQVAGAHLGLAKMDRVKLEVPLDKGIGVYDDRDVAYHECHVKLLLDPDEVDCLEEAIQQGWVVSRNLLFTEVSGLEKWYLTKRMYDTPALTASRFFNFAWERVRHYVGPYARMEMETVIHDSNPGLDDGWWA